MNAKSIVTRRILPGILCLLTTNSVNGALIGPVNRDYEYLLFDGSVTYNNSKSESTTLSILSNADSWKSTSSDNAANWKTKDIGTDNSWQYAVEVQNTISPANKIIPNTNASLIWTDGQGADGSNKAYFRNTFNIPDGSTVTGASATVLADDFFAMSVNGHFVTNAYLDDQIQANTTNDGLGVPKVIDFSNWLISGNNTISIFAYDGYKVSAQDLIKDGISVSNQIASDTHSITASFTPSKALSGITISDAADILGYDHFNWYQTIYRKSADELGQIVITDPNYIGDKFVVNNPEYAPSGYCATNPCTDPPENYPLKYNGPADNQPFYYNELDLSNRINALASSDLAEECLTPDLANSYICHINDSEKTLGFYDSPVGGPLWYAKTVLAGINEKIDKGNIVGRTWDALYDFNWQAGAAAVRNGPKVISADTDLTVYPIVQQCMQGDGANLDVAGMDCFNAVEEPPIWSLFLTGPFVIVFMKFKKSQGVIKNARIMPCYRCLFFNLT